MKEGGFAQSVHLHYGLPRLYMGSRGDWMSKNPLKMFSVLQNFWFRYPWSVNGWMLAMLLWKWHAHLDPHNRHSAIVDHCQKFVTRLDRSFICPSIICYHTFPTQNHTLPFFQGLQVPLVWHVNTDEPKSSLPQGMAYHTQSQNLSTWLGIKPHFCANFCSSVCSLKDKTFMAPLGHVLMLFSPGPVCPELTEDLSISEALLSG